MCCSRHTLKEEIYKVFLIFDVHRYIPVHFNFSVGLTFVNALLLLRIPYFPWSVLLIMRVSCDVLGSGGDIFFLRPRNFVNQPQPRTPNATDDDFFNLRETGIRRRRGRQCGRLPRS